MSNKKILILERYKQKWFGGRLGNELFHGVSVVKGAGVGRKEKDYLLIKLLKELKIKYDEGIVQQVQAQTIEPKCNVKQIITYLRKEYTQSNQSNHIKFKEFAKPLLGEKYEHFTMCAGYTDYENEDAFDTLYNYGFEDNTSGWTAMYIHWKTLIEKMVEKVGKIIKVSSNVIKLENYENGYYVYCENGKIYTSEKVILATTIPSVKNLLQNPIYEQIHSQPFLRIYGKFSKASVPIMKEYVQHITLVPGPLHKMIPCDIENGIYMIAYTDNKGATFLKDYKENTMENREFLSELVQKSLGIPIKIKLPSILGFYWQIGTHYYGPLKGFKNPAKNMIVVGEMISNNQGWTEGALESVEKVVTKKWIME
jgi:hypothetical protein